MVTGRCSGPSAFTRYKETFSCSALLEASISQHRIVWKQRRVTSDICTSFDYDTNTGGFADCNCPTCFTSTAYGDVDGDGDISLILFTHPNINKTETCTSLYFPDKGIPQIRNGQKIYDEPVLVTGGDNF